MPSFSSKSGSVENKILALVEESHLFRLICLRHIGNLEFTYKGRRLLKTRIAGLRLAHER